MRKSADDLEEKLEMMRLENELLSEELSANKKKAIIRQIKKKYGKNWRGSLGGMKDSGMLQQFANAGRTMSSFGPTEKSDGKKKSIRDVV